MPRSAFESLAPDLLRAAHHGKTPAARAAAVDALAVCCFVLAESDAETRGAMDALRGIWSGSAAAKKVGQQPKPAAAPGSGAAAAAVPGRDAVPA